jgi:hypothetical protein
MSYEVLHKLSLVPQGTITSKFRKRVYGELKSKRKESKIPSGNITPSRLLWPDQHKKLWMMRVPIAERKLSIATMRRMERGNIIEQWLLDTVPPLDDQMVINYRGVEGKADRLEDSSSWGFGQDTMLNEIKSVTDEFNAFYPLSKWEEVKDRPLYEHCIQQATYALGRGDLYFAVSYVRSEDLCIITHVMLTDHFRKDVNLLIDNLEGLKMLRTIPMYKPTSDTYNRYPEYRHMSAEELHEAYLGITLGQRTLEAVV